MMVSAIMEIERPDLSQVDAEIVAYIESLEKALLMAQSGGRRGSSAETRPTLEPSEPETTINIIVVTADGFVKRTPRHHYLRQRRSGKGIFDIDTPESAPPVIVCSADFSADVLIITSEGRIFRLPVAKLPETALRARGSDLGKLLASPLLADEVVVAMLVADGGLYVNLASQRGRVRRVRKTYLSAKMVQGIRYHKISEGGVVVSACWSTGDQDIFLGTRKGLGIRFSERQIPNSGCRGIRLKPDDAVVTIAATSHEGGLLVLGSDGKGTIRLMAGFRQNKAPGAGGKVVIKAQRMVGCVSVGEGGDVFAISRTSKMIRFAAAEVPPKTGVVQGVNCMGLRGDEVMAFTISGENEAAGSK